MSEPIFSADIHKVFDGYEISDIISIAVRASIPIVDSDLRSSLMIAIATMHTAIATRVWESLSKSNIAIARWLQDFIPIPLTVFSENGGRRR